jgi:hypothetical protein
MMYGDKSRKSGASTHKALASATPIKLIVIRE